MKNWSIPAGSVFGVSLRIHVTFAFLLAFVWMTEAVQSGKEGAIRGVALVAIIFGSVLLHELGHAFVALRNDVDVKSIVLLPIGGITIMDDESYRNPDPQRDMRIAAAGPLVNLVIAVFVGSALLLFLPEVNLFARPWVHSQNLPRSLFWGNLFLGAFNLLPAYPLDGGRVLRAYLAERMDPIRATRKAVTFGQMFAMAFILAGAIWDAWLMLIGVFLFLGAQLEDRTAVFQSVLQSVKMGDIMLTDFKTLSPADTLEDAMYKALHSLQDDFPVVRGSDMVGSISRQRILESLRAHGNGYIQGAMLRIADVAQRDDTLATVLKRLGAAGISLIPVVDGEHLVGIVTMQNLSHSMALLAETKRLQEQARTQE
jgi:Zn-dependent protease/CBS domain-containing protein